MKVTTADLFIGIGAAAISMGAAMAYYYSRKKGADRGSPPLQFLIEALKDMQENLNVESQANSISASIMLSAEISIPTRWHLF